MDRAFQRIRSLMLRGTFYSVPPMTGQPSLKAMRFLSGGMEVLLTNIAIRERIVHLLRMPLPTGSYGRGY